jgi:hypothetical protein
MSDPVVADEATGAALTAWTTKGRKSMGEHDNAAVLKRAKAIANDDGFAWELDFGEPGLPRAKVRGQHFLSKDRQEEYLERARLELRKEVSNV